MAPLFCFGRDGPCIDLSTDFQLLYAKDTFLKERASWRGVILLNVVRSISRVVGAIAQAEADNEGPDSGDERTSSLRPPLSSLVTDELVRLCTRLRTPLGDVERILRSRISSQPGHHSRAFQQPRSSLPRPRPSSAPPTDQEAETEVFVQSRAGWHGPLREAPTYGPEMAQQQHPYGTFVRDGGIDASNPSDPVHIVRMCREDMIALWTDPSVQEILRRKKMRWHEWPGL